jgi:CMP-N-acetylneuraminic acid synthetase
MVKEVPAIDRAVVSTDHPEIASVAEDAGLGAPFMRPPELSGDRIADWDVLNHALLEMERLDETTYDIIVMLQPTSPMRTAQQVTDAIEKLVSENWDSVWTVSETDSKAHPLKQLRVEEGQLQYYDARGSGIIARQELDTIYHRNGAAYVMTRECLVEQRTIKGARAGALITSSEMVSIDTWWDFKLVEFLLSDTPS